MPSFSPGTRLGPYEVVAPLGAGGMGEVYRARDTRLNREVALKVLPAEVAQDPARRHRFEQEARAASALNHPNIVTVYDVGTVDGVSFIVTELVDGEPLRALLLRGPVALRRILDLAVPLADGLATAHAAGIVHRDLKPENIMVTRQGRIKILDFGLAKQIVTTPTTAEDATLTFAPTQPGMVMGTVGYMSPEQVRGKPADHRSDIFSLGAILYEMLSGKRAFTGESPADAMSAILDKEPAELAESPSPGLERVVRRCLEKEPVRRFQSAHDLAFAIQSLSVATTTPGAGSPVVKDKPTRRRLAPILAGLALAAAAASAGFFAGKGFWKTAPAKYQQLTYRRGMVSAAAFAPDGQTIVYSAAWDGSPNEIFAVRAASPESRPLGLAGARLFSISSTGEMAVALEARYKFHSSFYGTLARVSLSGGVPRVLLKDVHEAVWTPSGDSLAVVHRVEGQERLEFPIGKVLYVSTGWISHPRFSPAGDRIAFLDHPVPSDDRGSVVVTDLAGNKSTLSSGWQSARGLAWSPDGKEIWFTAALSGRPKSISAVTLDGKQRVVASMPAELSLWDIRADGRLLLEHQTKRSEMLGLTRGEKAERNLAYLDNPRSDDLSPDGKTLLFTEQGEATGSNYAVCLRGTDGSPAMRLGEGRALALSPDGKWALSALFASPHQLVLLPIGEGDPRRLPQTGLNFGTYGCWHPDGRRVLFSGSEPGHRSRVWMQDTEGGKPQPVTPEGTSLLGNALSPDGKRVVASFLGGGLAIFSLEGGAQPRPVPGVNPGEQMIRWDSTGRRIYVYQPSQLPAKVVRVDVDSGAREPVREFTPADPTGVFSIRALQVTPDGGSAVYSFYRITSELYLVEGLR